MTPFKEELAELNRLKEKADKDELTAIMMRQTQMFLELAKILENDNKK